MIKVSDCSFRPVVESCGLDNINWQIDPYIGCEHQCYYCYAFEKAETDWSKEMQMHYDISAQLEMELNSMKINP
jgi:DNA repair photolyase